MTLLSWPPAEPEGCHSTFVGNTGFPSLAGFRLSFRPHVLSLSPANLAHPQHSARSYFPLPWGPLHLTLPPYLSALWLSPPQASPTDRLSRPTLVSAPLPASSAMSDRTWLFSSFLKLWRGRGRHLTGKSAIGGPGWPAGCRAMGSRLQFVSQSGLGPSLARV